MSILSGLMWDWKRRNKSKTARKIEQMFIDGEKTYTMWTTDKSDMHIAIIEEIIEMAEASEDADRVYEMAMEEYSNHKENVGHRTDFLKLFYYRVGQEVLFKALQIKNVFADTNILNELHGYAKIDMLDVISGLQKYAEWDDVRILHACEKFSWNGERGRKILAEKITYWDTDRRVKAVRGLTARNVKEIRERLA